MSHINIGTPAFETSSRLFRCPKGHSIRSNVPITIGYYADPDKGTPICPVCLSMFVRENFPMEEVIKTTFVAVEQQKAAPQVLMPVVQMCEREGCILARHPPEQQHIGKDRQPMV